MFFEKLSDIKIDLWNYLKRCNKKIVMYGTGNGADKILDVLIEKGIELYGIFASDSFVRERTFRGYKVKKYSDFCNELDDFLVIVSFASQRDEVLDNIFKISSERELYAPDVPVYGDGLFDLEFFNKHKEKFRKVYEKLSDDLSKITFVNTIAYKLTGNISFLRECETSSENINKLLKSIITQYNYLDVGAYTGDTVEEYTDNFGKDIEAYAFEPDKKNYAKMQKRFEEKSIKCNTYNMAAWDKNETIRFYSRSGRAGTSDMNSKCNKYNDIIGKRIDDLCLKDIGFVKIDAEGSDVNALEGMTELIRTQLPCVKVAAYHKNDDYFTIPELIDRINSNYKLYMRHLKYIPGWDTDFIFEFIKN